LGFAPKTFRRDGGTENKREDKRGITLAPPTRARVISNELPKDSFTKLFKLVIIIVSRKKPLYYILYTIMLYN